LVDFDIIFFSKSTSVGWLRRFFLWSKSLSLFFCSQPVSSLSFLYTPSLLVLFTPSLLHSFTRHQHLPALTSTYQSLTHHPSLLHSPALTSPHQPSPALTSPHQHSPALTSTHPFTLHSSPFTLHSSLLHSPPALTSTYQSLTPHPSLLHSSSSSLLHFFTPSLTHHQHLPALTSHSLTTLHSFTHSLTSTHQHLPALTSTHQSLTTLHSSHSEGRFKSKRAPPIQTTLHSEGRRRFKSAADPNKSLTREEASKQANKRRRRGFIPAQAGRQAGERVSPKQSGRTHGLTHSQ